MLNYNEIKPGKYIILDGDPYLVLEYSFSRVQQMKPVAQTKIRNLITGRIIEKAFRQTEKVEEAEIEKRDIKYLYTNKREFWFCEMNDPSKRFKLNEKEIDSDTAKFLKTNMAVEIVTFDEKIISVNLPIKMELKVTEAPPSIKGNTAQGGSKPVTLETGAIINAPLFIEEGDVVVVNTQTGEYVSRV